MLIPAQGVLVQNGLGLPLKRPAAGMVQNGVRWPAPQLHPLSLSAATINIFQNMQRINGGVLGIQQ